MKWTFETSVRLPSHLMSSCSVIRCVCVSVCVCSKRTDQEIPKITKMHLDHPLLASSSVDH